MRAATANISKPATTSQTLAPKKSTDDKPTLFKDISGNDVQLSVNIVKNYLCGNDNRISDAEAYMFLQLCKYQGLNPFLREVYLCKYGSSPAQMIVGKETFTKRAQKNPKYKGSKAGVVIINRDGKYEERIGEIVLEGETLVGGWAEVNVDGYIDPIKSTVGFNERCQFKDGKPMAKWATSPALMIRKCALVAALREAFPDSLGGMYSAEEMGFEEAEVNSAPITPPNANATDAEYVPVDETTGEIMDDGIDSLFGGNNA